MDKVSAYIYFDCEAVPALRRALINVLNAHYNTGFTLLRSALEMFIKGVFLNYMRSKIVKR